MLSTFHLNVPNLKQSTSTNKQKILILATNVTCDVLEAFTFHQLHQDGFLPREGKGLSSPHAVKSRSRADKRHAPRRGGC
jgi:hypothetical protein